MFALPVAAAVFALAAQGMMPAAPNGDTQAIKTVCRPFKSSTKHTAPICKGGGPLEAQPACFCHGPDVRSDEPACWPDGSPAMFPHGRTPTAADEARMISCVDYDRQQSRHHR